MTALAKRRSRRTVAAATVALGLVIVASVLFGVGVVTLSNSQEGEAVGIDPRPSEQLPATPNALLAVTDDEGNLASLVVLTLLPEGQGGSIVTVPVNADSSAGFGAQRRPLDELFDPEQLDDLVVAVEDMLSITIEEAAIVGPAGLEALLAPIESVQVVLPDAVIDSDGEGATVETPSTAPTTSPSTTTDRSDDETVGSVPADSVPADSVPADSVPADSVPADSVPEGDGVESDEAAPVIDGLVLGAGPQVLGPAEVVRVLTAIDESVPRYDQHQLDVTMWSALAKTAPIVVAPEPVPTNDLGRPATPTSVEELLTLLFEGDVAVRDLVAVAPGDDTNPTAVDVVVIDRADAALVFAQISPALVATARPGSKSRVVAQFTDEQLAATDGLYDSNSDLARVLIERLIFVQANIVSVDTLPTGAPEITIIEVADPNRLEQTRTEAELLFGPTEVRLATTVLEGVDIVITLGTSYLQHEAETNAGRFAPTPDVTTPEVTTGAGTVEADG